MIESENAPRMPVQTLDSLKARLAAMRGAGMGWRQIAAEFPGVPAGTLCAISKGRDPLKAATRAALRLPLLAPAPVCPIHGVVHSRQCRPPAPEWVSVGADFLSERLKRNG